MAEVLNHSNGAHPLPSPGWLTATDRAGTPAATVRIPDDWPSGLYVAHVTAGGIHRGGGIASPQAVGRLAGSFDRSTNSTSLSSCVHASPGRNPASSCSSTTPPTRRTTSGAAASTAFELQFSCYTSPGAGDEVMPWGFRISFRRPFIGEAPFVGKKWIYWEEPLAKWLGRLEIDVEWATLVDLHEDPRLLDAYDHGREHGPRGVFLDEMYDRLQAFIARGGNAAFFSGNNCWWRIRIEDGGDTMVCYKKDVDSTPASVREDDQLDGAGVGRAHGTTLGAVLSPAPPDGSHSRDDDDGKPAHFVVRAPDHWVFAGTDLAGGRRVRNFRRRRHGGRLRDRLPVGGTR